MYIDEIQIKVKNIMTSHFVKVYKGDDIRLAYKQMIARDVGEVIIVDRDEKILGLFTTHDMSKISPDHCYFSRDFFEKYAKKNVITISPDASVREANLMMINHKIGRLPVVENGHIIGVVSSRELIDAFFPKLNALFDLQTDIMDKVHEAICITDSLGRVMFWNKSSEMLYGVRANDIVGKPIREFFPNAMVLHVLETKEAIQNVQHEPVEGKCVALSSVPVFDKEGKLVAAVSTDRDITEVYDLSKALESEKQKVAALKDVYQRAIASNYRFDGIIGKSESIIKVMSVVQKVAPSSASVLITGESGTGKEVFAKAIHDASGRSGAFIAVNCSAIPPQLLESELFGYVEGAFTGAVKKGMIGKFELANAGTIFLDEIGDMPIDMQVKLLRVLQDGVIYKLGSEKPIVSSARVIAAANRDLKKLMKEGAFRDDLFYRLAVVQVELPPLRERKEDIKELINFFIEHVSATDHISINTIDEKIYPILSAYHWEGNIRELRNVVQRMVVLSSRGEITISNIPEYILKHYETIKPNSNLNNGDMDTSKLTSILSGCTDLSEHLKRIEIQIIKEALKQTEGNKQRTAELLNIKRSTLYYKMNQYKIEVN